LFLYDLFKLLTALGIRHIGTKSAKGLCKKYKSIDKIAEASLKKKFKDKKFAAGCSRDVIKEGSEKLGWELNDLFEQTILAMRESEDLVNKEMTEI
jgi:predicted hydrolase (HD superfamily)